MIVIHDVKDMQAHAEAIRLEGRRIAFVPTMGYLHQGHLSLMREGKRRADVLVSSIFVNPTQFGPNEDLEAYPRDFEGDEKAMREVGVDVVFYPSVEDIYPQGYQTFVTVEKVTQGLCGASRPVHFRGVATVVAKLFNIVKPHVALFGDKDFQQRLVIQQMVRDLNFDVEVVGCPIVRETDGLAMSSRNAYLSTRERQDALTLSRALDATGQLFDRGVRDASALLREARGVIDQAPALRLDYMTLCDAETLEDIDEVRRTAVLALAAFLGRTRLIDNRVFG